MTGTLRNRKRQKEDSSSSIATIQDEKKASSENDNGKDEKVESCRVIPLVRRSRVTRLDVGPFVILYAILVACDLQIIATDDWILTAAFGATLLLHLLVVLSCQWNVVVQATVGFQMGQLTEADMKNWTHALVHPIHETVKGGLVPMQFDNDASGGVAQITFHDTTFRCRSVDDLDITLWDSKKIESTAKREVRFRSLKYPIAWPRSRYSTWTGHSLESAVNACHVYGPNATKLALPTFWSLLSHQLVAPFFLFQVFCVVLWSLDEYWYYAMFTLVALLIFESTVAYNRLQSLQKLHQAGHDGFQRVWAYRRGLPEGPKHWMQVSMKELVPGDVISLAVGLDGSPTNVPADIAIMEGSAVCDEALLTGESVPQLKQPLDKSSHDELDLQDSSCQESILFGGTNLIVGTADEDSKNKPPDKGITGFVLRTGFGTAQGNLLRTMAHTSHTSDSVHTWDSFYFIAVLIFCALLAAGWVLADGWDNPKRNRFRLVLHVVIIVTSVVPPELPMELSLALTNSVAALVQHCQVYCTELNRIPWAGQVDVCCFDKTGTLTSDEMCLRGVRLFPAAKNADAPSDEENSLVLPSSSEVPWEVIRVMAACQALAVAGIRRRNQAPRLIGDPLEQAVLKESGFTPETNSLVKNNEGTVLGILHRFPFTSKLKRMTVLAAEGAGSKVWALTKGAPETVKSLLRADSIPPNFDAVSFHHMSHGRRVLAMAYREAGTIGQIHTLKSSTQTAVEKDLTFCGFLVLDCPLKVDSAKIIQELTLSRHRTVMITGDSLLTASEVARQVGIVPKKISESIVYQIREREDLTDQSKDVLSRFECAILRAQSLEDAKPISLSEKSIPELIELRDSKKSSFCIAGDTLSKICRASHEVDDSSTLDMSTADEKEILLHPTTQAIVSKLVPLVDVFARHTPHQKEAVVAALNSSGAYTLYAGDGVNDVGALKRAHVGISILSAPEAESKQRKANKKMAKLKKSKKGRSRANATSFEESLRQLKEAQEEINEVELGDASVAAPFTSRAVSIKCCKDVIQQGRCTLVTMLTIYKILGINCLVNALVLSRLFLNGVKQGDRQLTILGIGVAALFFFVTRGEPLPTLSSVRPPVSVLCVQALLSIFLQFLVHVGAILIAAETALMFADPYDPSLVPDGPFNPNTLNTCTFLMTCLSTVNTFAVNYRGRPFLKDLRENKMLYKSVLACYGCLAVCTLEIFPPLNDLMQLTALPEAAERSSTYNDSFVINAIDGVGFPIFMAGLMVIDTVLVSYIESTILRYVKG